MAMQRGQNLILLHVIAKKGSRFLMIHFCGRMSLSHATSCGGDDE